MIVSIYGLPAPAKTVLGPTVHLRLVPSVPLTSLVPAGLVTKPVTIQGHPAVLATTPKVVGTELTAEVGRVHVYWQPTADTVIAVTTSEMGESLATAIARESATSSATWSKQPGLAPPRAPARPAAEGLGRTRSQVGSVRPGYLRLSSGGTEGQGAKGAGRRPGVSSTMASATGP